jgi:hypothetical protein
VLLPLWARPGPVERTLQGLLLSVGSLGVLPLNRLPACNFEGEEGGSSQVNFPCASSPKDARKGRN